MPRGRSLRKTKPSPASAAPPSVCPGPVLGLPLMALSTSLENLSMRAFMSSKRPMVFERVPLLSEAAGAGARASEAAGAGAGVEHEIGRAHV